MLYGINKVSTGVGSNGYLETKADLNQRIGETTAIRINLMNRDEDSPRSNPVTGTTPEIHRQGVAPSISFGLGTDHELTLSHLWLQTNDRPDYGVPFNSAAHKPETNYAKSDAYWGVSGQFDESQTNVTTLNYLWKISADTQWRTVARAANYYRSYWAGAPQGGAPGVNGGSAKTREFDTDNFVLQSDFNTNFTLFGMKNELVTGVEYLKEGSKRWALRNLGTTANPVYKSGHYTTAAPNTYSGDTYSAYAQDTVEFVRDWKITVGLRRDEMRSEYQSPVGSAGASTNFRGDFGENSYRTGLSWQPDAAQHYYVGWSDSFSPTADLYQLSGSQYPAERSKVTEIGAKWLLLDGNLAFRTSLYHAVKDWERNTDLESTASILTKKRESNGIELELAGRMTDNWEVFSGLSLIDAEINEVAPSGGNVNFVGKMPRNTPKQTFNLWTTYQLPLGFKVGGGMEFKSKRYGGAPTGTGAFNPNWVPSYTRWDAMVAYEQPKYAIKLNVQNVFDKLYYDAIYDNGGFTYVGQPRRVILSAEYKF
jgi:catecholate siderophore receptor